MTVPLSLDLAPASRRAGSLKEAYAACLSLCRAHYENFPVASFLIPAAFRGPMAAVYAFARVADDFADEPVWEAPERLRLLADWRARLRGCAASHGQHPVFWALSDSIARFRLPLAPFEKLIDAFEMDVRSKRKETFEDVLHYCRHSANPVGELVLRLFGEWDERKGAWSDAICTALQLANFWQDLVLDARKNRIYVPLEDVRAAGLSEEDVLAGSNLPALKALMCRQVERTRKLFDEGMPLCDAVRPRLGRQLRLVWLGGSRILEKIEAQEWDVWIARPALTRADAPGLAKRWLFWKGAR
jgi:hydroxysqualene synthase